MRYEKELASYCSTLAPFHTDTHGKKKSSKMIEESEVTKITYTNGNRKFSIIQIEFTISRSKQIVAHITSFGMHKSSHTIGMQKNKK